MNLNDRIKALVAAMDGRVRPWAARPKWRGWAYEFLLFGLKQAWACLFGGLMLALLIGTRLWWPADAAMHRYDFLVVAALTLQFGLLALRLETWRGLVFATMDPDAAPLAEHVAPLETLLAERGLDLAAPALRRSHDLACDWKTYAENYLEGYHIGSVHPLLADELGGAEYRVRVEGDLVLQEAVGVNDGPQAGVWGWLWPNLGINVYRDGAMIERMTPVGPGRTRLDYLFLNDGGEDALGEALTASDRLTAEDAAICEAVQRNLSAGAYDRGVLSPNHEIALAWFQARIAEVHP